VGEPVITARGLRKSYGDLVAVHDVSFSVERGEIFGIIGPNGSGKTTTVECLQGLRVADGGELDVLGLDPMRQADALRRRIGSQLQESALPDRMRVWEALDLFASLVPGARPWEESAREWDLWEKRSAAFSTLSGGQRQRLFIALALAGNPELVFLDEMTAGLDPGARRATWELVRAVRDRGTTVVLVTHFMDEAEALCDRIAVIREGRVVALDTPAGLMDSIDGGTTVTFSAPEGDSFDWLREIPGAAEVIRDGRLVLVKGSGPLLAYVGAALVGRGIAPLDLAVQRQSLEDVFLRLTNREPGQ
jgi:ABC-2 type transport system ATP-binding protein